ncbi:beta-1,4 N-acetylgalactosaminyltransferase 2-like isoform 2-T2 [Rhinophrynus dorsalis]
MGVMTMKHKTWILCICLGILSLLSIKRYLQNIAESHPVVKPSSSFNLKLLPEEKIFATFSHDGMNFLSGHACSCKKQEGLSVYQLKDYLQQNETELIKERRKKEFMHFQKRDGSLKKKIIIAQPNSALSYPIQGIQVLPLHTIQIEGLGVHEERMQNYQVILKASLGIFNTLADVSEEHIKGRGTNTLIISTPYQQVLNHILKYVTYTSTEFNIDTVDVVKFKMGKNIALFPVEIKQPQMPLLFDAGPGQKISSMVTITTKTFLRYNKLRILIKSIRQLYPDVKIIIADDNENPEKIVEANVEQYFMPFAKGWFAGRNLAVSQVGGKLDGNDFKFKILYQEGDDEGGCLHRRSGHYNKIDGFSNCVLSSVVANLFLAHTRKVLAVGFDPKLDRVAHSEFFFDGFGSLRVGSCNDIGVSHQKRIQQLESNYNKFRYDNDVNFKMGLFYFKNYLKCYTQN